jgi:hypothetical protein
MLVDDMVSAALNYADGTWKPEADGTYGTHVIRRQKPADEGPDDVRGAYRAELAPLTVTVASDPGSGRLTMLMDVSGFSSGPGPTSLRESPWDPTGVRRSSL